MPKILTKEQIIQVLSSRFSNDIHTKLSSMPLPHLFKDIKKATQRIKKAWENREKIAIVGDYDADGIIASAILSEFFDELGISYTLYIPNRFTDGYGLNANIVQKLEATLIITVDNGITATKAALTCKEKGIDLIITDHHNIPPILPKAYAIVNPKQTDCRFPIKQICGAQVAWYLCASIKNEYALQCDLSKWLDVLAVAIIADMMELKDLNRTMVKQGLKRINSLQRPAFLAIKDFFNKNRFSSDDISFLIAPLINSTGRMKDASLSYEFLRCDTYDDAMMLLEKIVGLNDKRKSEESVLFESSLEMVDEDEKIIVVWGESWHEGVIGIVASRLSRRFKKPAIVFSVQGDRAKGSARSIGEIDILSLISQNKEIILGHGGHKSAAGISIETKMLPLLKQRLSQQANLIEEKFFHSTKEVLGEIDPKEIDFELLNILQKYEPYGEKNPRPNFLIREIDVKANKVIGKEKNHLKLILQTQQKTLESLFFNFDTFAKRGDTIDIIFSVSKNSYRGLVTPQLLIKEIIAK